jgi:hypothetical protein
MGYVFTATTASGAPDIEAGLYDARFDGVTKKFITGGQYGDGDRLEWMFTLLSDDGQVLYEGGDPLQVPGLTSLNLNPQSDKSVGVKWLRAICNPAQFAAFSAGEGLNEDAIVGATVQVEVRIKANGWPYVALVLPARKARKTKE